jgi:hypothetical protein
VEELLNLDADLMMQNRSGNLKIIRANINNLLLKDLD